MNSSSPSSSSPPSSSPSFSQYSFPSSSPTSSRAQSSSSPTHSATSLSSSSPTSSTSPSTSSSVSSSSVRFSNPQSSHPFNYNLSYHYPHMINSTTLTHQQKEQMKAKVKQMSPSLSQSSTMPSIKSSLPSSIQQQNPGINKVKSLSSSSPSSSSLTTPSLSSSSSLSFPLSSSPSASRSSILSKSSLPLPLSESFSLSYLKYKLKDFHKEYEGNIFLLAIMLIILLALICVLAALIAVPILASLLLVWVVISVLFVITEAHSTGIWHHNRESENRFWCFQSAFLSSALLFSPDSPIGYGWDYPWIALLIVLLSSLYVNYQDRQMSRISLSRSQHMKRVNSFHLSDSKSSKEKLLLMSNHIDSLDFKFVGQKVLNQKSIQFHEESILSILKECSREEFNYLITNVNLSLLFYKMKDKDLMAWSKNSLLNRTRLLTLLAIERLSELSVPSRVVVIDALMNLRLKAHLDSESMIMNILLHTRGLHLTRLKSLCDAKGKATNLHKLIFNDIHSTEIRTAILKHFQAEANFLKQTDRGVVTRRKILSDVDDTLFSSGGRFPAGLDTKYLRHVVYPGVLQFYKELDLGVDEDGKWEEGRIGNLIFLSARPHVYKDKSEMKSYEIFENLRIQYRLHCVPTLLAGTLDAGLKSFGGNFDPMAIVKFSNFEQLVQLYPEFTYVWIGDSGQGDVICGEMMSEKYGDKMSGTFMHEVQPRYKIPGFISNERYEKKKIHFFETYIGAATHAARMGLIHSNGLRRVAHSAIEYLISLKPTMTAAIWEARRVEMNLDIEFANEYLSSIPPPFHSPLIDFIVADCYFPQGSIVWTHYGAGQVESISLISSIYHVKLLDWKLASPSQSVRIHCHHSQLQWYHKGIPGDAVWTKWGTGILTEIRNDYGVHVVILLEWKLNIPLRKFSPPPPLVTTSSHGKSSSATIAVTTLPSVSSPTYYINNNKDNKESKDNDSSNANEMKRNESRRSSSVSSLDAIALSPSPSPSPSPIPLSTLSYSHSPSPTLTSSTSASAPSSFSTFDASPSPKSALSTTSESFKERIMAKFTTSPPLKGLTGQTNSGTNTPTPSTPTIGSIQSSSSPSSSHSPSPSLTSVVTNSPVLRGLSFPSFNRSAKTPSTDDVSASSSPLISPSPSPSSNSSLSYAPSSSYDPKFAVGYFQPNEFELISAAVGDPVETLFGKGKVIKYRHFDSIYEVQLRPWGEKDIIDDMEDSGYPYGGLMTNPQGTAKDSSSLSSVSTASKKKGVVFVPLSRGPRIYCTASAFIRLEKVQKNRCIIM